MTRTAREFLPTALEIQVTPPLIAARCILWSIMLLFTTAIAWASVGRVNIVGVAQGKIVPTDRVKVIQALESGVVQGIHVREGDHVTAGQLLLTLDPTQARANRDQVRTEELALKVDRARLQTVLSAIVGTVADDVFTDFEAENAGQVRLQKDRARVQLDQYHARLFALAAELRQREAERDAASNRIQQLEATIPLITERAQSHRRLAETKLAPRAQWLEMEQARIEQVKQRDMEGNNVVRLEAAVSGIHRRREALQAEFAEGLLVELAAVENRLAGLEQDLVKAEKRLSLQSLSAPVSGAVHRLAVHTIGGVVTPAQELMQIVPEGEAMEIEAWIRNRDIGFVRAGQDAVIKLETFPFTKFGTIAGEVRTVSGDATPDDRLGLAYSARVRMHSAAMRVEGKWVNLAPGMAASVEINMGTRRLIDFLLSPLLRYREESVRER